MVVSPSAANIGTPHRHNGKAETATLRFINTRLALRIVEAMRPLPVHLFFALNPQHTLHPLRITGVLPFTTALALWHWRPPRDRPPLWIQERIGLQFHQPRITQSHRGVEPLESFRATYTKRRTANVITALTS